MAFEHTWMFPEFHHTAFADSWNISEIFSKDTDTIARALERTLNEDVFSPEVMIESYMATPLPTPTISGGSENESITVVKARKIGPVPSGRVTKRRSRASKRALTTFINADPANFRQMVQRVTGAQFAAAPLLKPEPHRFGASIPTLDTSGFCFNGAGSVMEMPETVTETAAVDGGASTALDFDSFCSFPTLESWKVM